MTSYSSTSDLYTLLVDSIQDYAIFVLDATGHVVSWNPGAQRIKGYEASEIIGRHFSVFYPPEDLAKPPYELEVAAATGRFEDEGWRLRKDGTRFWANVVITALRAPEGELVGFAKVTRDLTERINAQHKAIEDARRLASEEALRTAAEIRARELSWLLERLKNQAEELARQRAEADAANRTKSEFLAAMSHELRTPLNAIAGYVELLMLGVRGALTEAQRADLARIQRSQQYLLSLINDILNFSRLEAGHVTYDIESISVASVIENVVAMIAPQTTAKAIDFRRVSCPADLRARGDASKVEQVLLNLLSNAVKFTPENGRVTLRCTAQPDRVLVHVEDTGLGIPLDRQAEIFEPFVQLDRTLQSPRDGAGLGLAISRDLARGMGGELTVVSEVGVGSTFTLSLPRDTIASLSNGAADRPADGPR
ncbi:MAG TPA: ATP-binding protein [Gemmatimonadaceae bacterium]|jgi:PAS domain S-box-containing protein|nr:ATP-binding protein [Gemmatimonadaceae bacterium]